MSQFFFFWNVRYSVYFLNNLMKDMNDMLISNKKYHFVAAIGQKIHLPWFFFWNVCIKISYFRTQTVKKHRIRTVRQTDFGN